MAQHLVELFPGHSQSVSVCGVHHQKQDVRACVVGAPGLSQRLLPAYDPHDEVQVLPLHLVTHTHTAWQQSVSFTLPNNHSLVREYRSLSVKTVF